MRKALVSLCLVLALAAGVATQAQETGGVVLQLGFLLDGSGSISSSDFSIIRNAVATAVADTTLVPQDGSVEVAVVQFFNQDAEVVVGNTVVTPQTINDIVNRIQRMPQGGGGTPLWVGLDVMATQMSRSPNFNSARRRVINVATDGQPQVPVLSIDVNDGIRRSLQFRDQAIGLGIDEIDAEGIGQATSDASFRNFLLDLVHPQPGVLLNNGDVNGSFQPGFVTLVDSFQDFEQAVRDKVQAILTSAGLNGNANGTGDTGGTGGDNGGAGGTAPGSDGRPIPFETPVGMVFLTGVLGAMLIALRFRSVLGLSSRS